MIGAVNFARDAGLDLSVKGGGHSAPGFGTNDGGVVIDLSLMRYVHVDPAARTARAGGGATWGDFNYATHAYGLATTGGIISTTGVAGLTLGGGIGHLARGYGLTSTICVSAAGGDRRRSGPHGQRRTRTRICSGRCGAAAATSGWSRPSSSSCTRSTTSTSACSSTRSTRPGPACGSTGTSSRTPPRRTAVSRPSRSPRRCRSSPRTRHGDTFCVAVVHWSGPLDQGESAMKPFRDLAPVVAEMVGPMPYPALNSAFDALFPKGIRGLLEGQLRDRADRRGHRRPRRARPQGARGQRHHAPLPHQRRLPSRRRRRDRLRLPRRQLRHGDPGRLVRPSRRRRPYPVGPGLLRRPPPPTPSRVATSTSWTTTTSRGSRTTTRATTTDWSPSKRTYDPDNLFHLNQNIPPWG